MFRAEFVVKKLFLTSAGFSIFFPRESVSLEGVYTGERVFSAFSVGERAW